MPSDLLTSHEAADLLSVSRATLYSYVSRGMLQSIALDSRSQRKYYRRSDLLALKHRNSFRKDPERAASEVIEFGQPILSTSVSLISETEHSYRGRSSRELAAHYCFEEVAQFLWAGQRGDKQLPAMRNEWQQPLDLGPLEDLPSHLSPVEKLQCILPLLDHQDLSYGAKPSVLVPSAIKILLYLTYLSALQPYKASASRTFESVWNVDARQLDTLLIIVADHELNIATFTARCAASAGATLYQAVQSGLAALQGYKHLHGQVAEAKRFFDEVLDEANPQPVIRRYLRQGGRIPGFHNPYRRLYAGRDPRVASLFGNLANAKQYSLLQRTVTLSEEATGEYARIDFALAVTERLLSLPRDSIFSLIALGRLAGIIAHILEQYASRRVIRPRAKYFPEPAFEH